MNWKLKGAVHSFWCSYDACLKESFPRVHVFAPAQRLGVADHAVGFLFGDVFGNVAEEAGSGAILHVYLSAPRQEPLG